jgi:hypothetical protein
MTTTPFRISIPQDDLDDLDRRLSAVRRPSELPGFGFLRPRRPDVRATRGTWTSLP